MYFHGGIKDTILFHFWKPRSIESMLKIDLYFKEIIFNLTFFFKVFLLSCFILFISAALYEGLKLLRENLIRYEIRREEESGSNR